MSVTLIEANRIIEGSIAVAAQLNERVSVVVCDPEGRLIALNRMDGAAVTANRGAIGKAVAAAAHGKPSGAIT
jgi:glc operon protein GlcG